MLPTQTSAPVQTTPQPPQLTGSLVVSVHAPTPVPQTVGAVDGHAHALPVQLAPVGQTLAQPPQCDGSLVVSKQLAPHLVCPPVQTQLLAIQTVPPVHVAPHDPQFALSLVVSVQAPGTAPQTVGRVAGQAHAPPPQVAPVGQVAPQPLQFAGSLVTSTQRPLQ
jgi:hypothetical protein